MAPSACRRVSQRLRQISSALRDLKNISTIHCLTGDLQSKSAEKGIIHCPAGYCATMHERGVDIDTLAGPAMHEIPVR